MKFIVSISLLLFSTISYGQFFSGQITYKTSIIPKEGFELDSSVLKTNGRISKYLITTGNYKSIYLDENGKESYSYTYNNGSKRMYDYYANQGYVTYRDSRKGNSTSYSTKVFRDSAAYILDFPCYQVQREKDYGFVTTYYSDSIKVDYESFRGHEVGNWYEEIKQVGGSISVKSITEFSNYTSIVEAIKVEEREVSNEEFKLPEIPTVASFQSLDTRVELKPLDNSQIKCYNKSIKKAAKIKGRKSDYTSYLQFIITESGQIEFIKVYNPDEFGLGEIAIYVLTNCGLEFIPGKIGSTIVASEVFFPIEFKLD